jgi:hypothetical protein
MSVGTSVFLRRSSMPSPAVWADAILKHGFKMELDREFDVATFSGFLPCKHEGKPAGFEYFFERVAEADAGLSKAELKRIGDRDVMVSFVTHSDLRGLATAVIAAAVLTELSDGIFWDQESNELFSGTSALRHARDIEIEANAPPRKAVTPPAPEVREVLLPVSVVFRGATLLTLETKESTPRRFTARFDTSAVPANAELEITALWEQPAGVSVRTLRAGAQRWSFEANGAVANAAVATDLAKHAQQLGVTESATRALIAAGAEAVPHLVSVLSNEQAAPGARQMAMVILGQLGARARPALPALESLARHPQLGGAAQQAIAKITR